MVYIDCRRELFSDISVPSQSEVNGLRKSVYDTEMLGYQNLASSEDVTVTVIDLKAGSGKSVSGTEMAGYQTRG